MYIKKTTQKTGGNPSSRDHNIRFFLQSFTQKVDHTWYMKGLAGWGRKTPRTIGVQIVVQLTICSIAIDCTTHNA